MKGVSGRGKISRGFYVLYTQNKNRPLWDGFCFANLFVLDHFHVDGDSRRKIKIRESFNNFWRRIQDVDKALMNAHFELLASVFVDER
jgi:hypothetical protein